MKRLKKSVRGSGVRAGLRRAALCFAACAAVAIAGSAIGAPAQPAGRGQQPAGRGEFVHYAELSGSVDPGSAAFLVEAIRDAQALNLIDEDGNNESY